MRQPESLAGASVTSSSPERAGVASAGLPSVPGILTADQVLATGKSIAAMQQREGAIGWPDGHVDAWNHVECADGAQRVRTPRRGAARLRWLRATQRPDGSWPKCAEDGSVLDDAVESNHAAYCTVGVWHELQVTRDDAFAQRMWPVARKGIEFALGLQQPRGEIIWQRQADGTPASYALLTGSSSMHHALRCAIALAEYVGEPQPDWELAAGQLGHAVACHPEAFADKSTLLDGLVLPGARRATARPRRGRAGWPRAGTRSWYPASASGASATSPGSPARRRASSRWRSTRSAITPGPWSCSTRCSTCAIRTAATGPAGSSPTGCTSRTSRAAGPRQRWSWPPTRCPAPAGDRESSPPVPRGGALVHRSTRPRAAASRRAARRGPTGRRRLSRAAFRRDPASGFGQPIPSPTRSSTRSEPSTRTSANPPDFSARW